MKTLDVHALHEGIQHTIEKLDKQKQQLEKLEKSVEHLAGMKDALKGKGGDAIRTFYEECHKPFLLFFGMFIDEYKKVLKQTQHAISSVESDSHGMIAEAFLSHDARHGVKHAREVTEQLTDAVNRQTSAIGHIVSLPAVNDTFFRMETEQAERLISDTLHKLFQFDGQQTQALETAKSDFQTMKKYIDQLETMYTDPKIEITGYKSGSILKSQEEENINQTFGAINPQMKQADDSPLEMMLKKLAENEKSKVDSVVKTGDSKKVSKNIIVINGKVYNTSEHREHIKTDFSNADVKQVVYNDTLYNVYISGNDMKLEPVVSLSDIKVDENGYVKILETAVELTGVYDLFKAATGRDPVSGEKVTGKDRVVASINSVPFAKIAKLEKLIDINKLINDGKKAKKASEVKNVAKDTGNGVPFYGKKSVPKGPYREVHGFPVKVKPGAQEKHIPNTPNYKQEIANGKNKSIFYGDNKTAQELLDKYAGKGQLLPNGKKERVDFGKPIGKYYDRDTGEYIETTRGMIHYGKDGAHIVPSEPLKK
ncbi:MULTISPECIES: T7SS effector LXG polymorphic toxin [Bacillus]|uniref:T7SS effector LXG polymorphic toxin n=1 Tax=Bacillus TaxID=1386 RepID=UPI00022D7B89|nr:MULTISPECIES: T7SS effector LXG polymorphic toxin [Bacillus]EHA31998.1 putative DNA binding protein [Bacillus subtilis subsp. subtilis str. SC-8]MBU8720763.1 DNA-binding protein [Bacillus subtilis]MCL0025372.1 T7SS effector LXG polymorphic toxin [Bacillus sp. C21]MCL8469809.1 T7SS effector LXG polymorphic toxin [Bacillus subtilis]MCM3009613.1 T7SS effector LXG polymorphic toxin [Bacillus subtilis]